jgi:hypothetical protein
VRFLDLKKINDGKLLKDKFSGVNLVAFAIVFASLGYYIINSSLAAGGTITVAATPTANTCSTRFSSQDVWPGYFYNQSAPAGSPTLSQRIDNLGLDVWRVQAVDGYNDDTTSLPYPKAYTGTDAHSVSAWNFKTLDKVVASGPATADKLVDLTAPPDVLWNGPGPLPAGGGTPGALYDQSYGELSQYYANVVKYFRTPLVASNSGGTVTYTSTSMTDTAKDFTAYSGGGYAVTATVRDNNGFSDWVTSTINTVTNSGHTVNLSAAWSTTNSGKPDVTITNATPSAGAAYNLDHTTLALSGNVNGTTATSNASPWPRPPALGTVKYFELFNESDLSNSFFPRSSPGLPAPVPTLTPVNVAGGTLTPGSTYTYRLTSIAINTAESTPGTSVSVTMPAGMNSVQINWNATSNLSLNPFAYKIYGRTAASTLGMVVVGRDASTGLTWTDKGSVTPSSAVPVTDGTPGLQIWRPREYTKMWNVVAPAIKAIDANAKVVGPVISNPASLAPLNVNTTAITTGPSDNSWRDSTDYVPYLMANGSPKPDVVSYHSYGGSDGSGSSDASYFSGLDAAISDFKAVDVPVLGSTPAWNTESNIDAGFLDNTDMRSVTHMGSSWLAYEMIQHCLQAPQLQEIFQFEVANTNTWNLFGSTPPAGCYPAPTCSSLKQGEPNLQYWMIYNASRYFPAGSKISTVSGVPAGFAALAVQPPGTQKTNVIVANIKSSATKGAGVADSVSIQFNGTPTSTKQVTVDGNTDFKNGPTVTDLGTQSNVLLNMSGFAVTILSFDTAPITPDTTPPVISNVSATNLSSSGATVTWDTDEAANTQVEYGTTTSYGSNTTLDVNLVTGHTANLTGLSPSTTYHYRVKSSDLSGNLATGTDNTFTATIVDSTPPTVSITSPTNGTTVSGKNLIVNATATDNLTVAGVQFKLDGVNLGSEDTASPYSTTWDTTNATNGAHTLTAVARDPSNNSATSTSVNVTVDNSNINLLSGKIATTNSSNNNPNVLGLITDGDKTLTNIADLNTGAVYIQYDLGASYNVDDVKLWHYYGDPRSYHDVLVELSNSSTFATGNTIVFNDDTNNSLGLGTGTDTEYAESSAGSNISFSAVNARYIRIYSNGSSSNTANHYVEAEAYASSTSGPKQGDLNNDNFVNITDLSIILSDYGKTKAQALNPACDINNDNNVNIFDLSILLSNYGT